MTRSQQIAAAILDTSAWCDEMAAAIRSAAGKSMKEMESILCNTSTKIEGRGAVLRAIVQMPADGDEPPAKVSELYALAEQVRRMMDAQQAYFKARARKEAGDRECGIAKQHEAAMRRTIRDIDERFTTTPAFPQMLEAEGRLK